MTPLPSSSLASVAAALLEKNKGLLAADESFPTIEKRFHALGIASTAENRRTYRDLLFTAPGISEFISGAILFDETLRQQGRDGTPMPAVLSRRQIIPGIKVDRGTVPLPAFAEEKITEGLDGLRDRLAEYHELGARFTKWRAVIAIGEGRPSRTCLEANARALALFAALSQEAGLLPLVEPEVLMDGAHDLARCADVTTEVLQIVFRTLEAHRVRLPEMLLKTSMVLPGNKSPQPASATQIAEATLQSLRQAVPAAVPGIVFLSGGQSPAEATERLAAICRIGGAPWTLSFSFGRALQENALATWHESPAQMPAAQAALLESARRNSIALHGTASPTR